MVFVEIDGNVIMAEAMKRRTEGEMIATYEKLIKRLKQCGITPKKQILNNECSEKYKEAIKNNNMTYELVPPDIHCRNIAEEGIQTFKNHVISVLCGTAEKIPLHL